MPVFALLDTTRGVIEVRHEKPSRPANRSPTLIWIDDFPPAHDSVTHWLPEPSGIPANATEVPYVIAVRPPLPFTEANASILAQIVARELKQSRAIREYSLNPTATARGRVQLIDDEISALRATLAQ